MARKYDNVTIRVYGETWTGNVMKVDGDIMVLKTDTGKMVYRFTQDITSIVINKKA